MGGKLEDLDLKRRNFAPGPGNYEANEIVFIPSGRFGSSLRPSIDGGKDSKY